jgi:subtilisin family serine protease
MSRLFNFWKESDLCGWEVACCTPSHRRIGNPRTGMAIAPAGTDPLAPSLYPSSSASYLPTDAAYPSTNTGPVAASLAENPATPLGVIEPDRSATTLVVDTTVLGTTGLTDIATSQSAVYNSVYGYGRVDAAAAIARLLGRAGSLPAVANLGGINWALDAVNAPEAWAQGYTGQGVVVAVVDSGVDYTHADLRNNIWVNAREVAGNGVDDDSNGYIDDIRGWDFVQYDNTPLDGTGHGTHLAGTIAAEHNAIGVNGIAYNAKVMPVRVLDNNGNGSYARIAEGVYYAVDNGANIVNLSLAGTGTSPQLQAAIQYANDRGVLVISAAGNNGGVSPLFPASLANQYGLAAGAVDVNNQFPSYSARSGATPVNYVVAPGSNLLSTAPNNAYQVDTGTSMSTAVVSGVAALLISAGLSVNYRIGPSQGLGGGGTNVAAQPRLTAAQLTNLLTTTANATGITV